MFHSACNPINDDALERIVSEFIKLSTLGIGRHGSMIEGNCEWSTKGLLKLTRSMLGLKALEAQHKSRENLDIEVARCIASHMPLL